MSRFQKFLKNTSTFLLLLLVSLILLYEFHLISKTLFIIIVVAKLVTSLQFIAGMYLNEKGMKKGNAEFMIYVFGGMGVRLLTMLGIILFLRQMLKLNFNSFILVFFIFYVFFLTLEIIYLAKYEVRLKKLK
jgi:hypothetical protein